MNANERSSWWVDDFEGRKADEQARMRRTLLPTPLEEYFEQRLREEERQQLIPTRVITRS